MLEKVTAAAKEPIAWARRSPWVFVALLAVAGIVFLRYSDTVKSKVLAGATAGSGFYKFLASVLGYAAALFVLLSGFDAAAAMITHGQTALAHPEATGFVSKALTALAGVAGSCALGFIATMPASRIVGHDSRAQNRIQALGTDPVKWDLAYGKTRNGRKILKATGIEIRITCTLDAVSEVPLMPSEYGKIIDYISLELKNGIGVTHSSTTCTGQFMRLILTPLLRKGQMGSCYESKYIPGAVGELNTVSTLAFSIVIPFTNQSGIREMDNAIPLDLLHGAELTVARKATPWDAVTEYIVTNVNASVVTTVVQDATNRKLEVPSLLCPGRYTLAASAGQSEVTFQGVGMVNSPIGANTTDGSKMLHAVMPLANRGLYGPSGGTGDFSDLQRYACPRFGQESTMYTEQYVASMVDALDLKRQPQEDPSEVADKSPVWPMVSQTYAQGSPKTNCVFLPVLLSGKDIKVSQLPLVKGTFTVLVDKTVPPSTGQWSLCTVEVKDMSPQVIAQAAMIMGGRPSTTDKETASGPNAKEQITRGNRQKLDFKGLPVTMESDPSATIQ